MPYERCADVGEIFWQDLKQADPEEIAARTGAMYRAGILPSAFFQSHPGYRSRPKQCTDNRGRNRSRLSHLFNGPPLSPAS